MTPGTGADQTSNFQSAINAAQSQQLPLFVPAGTYGINTVNITAPIEICSSPGGANLVSWNSQAPLINIAPSSPGNPFGFVRLSFLAMNGQGAAFSGGISNAALIMGSEVTQLLIENCSLANSSYHGIYVSECSGSTIVNNYINNNAQTGIFVIDGAYLIEDNHVDSSGNGSIRVWNSSISGNNSIVRNNNISNTGSTSGDGQNGNAINVFQANFVTIISNTIYNSAFSAIRLNASSNCQIIGNNSYSCNETAIFVEAPGAGDQYVGAVIDGNIIDICGTGISVTNVNQGGRRAVITSNQVTNVTNNTITYPGGSYQTQGRGINGEADCLIANNIVERTADWAIFIFPTNLNTGVLGTIDIIGQVENNMIKNCPGGIAFYKDDTTYGRMIIGGNTIYAYTTTTKYAAIVPVSYDGSMGSVDKLSGATDLGNATSSGFSNVVLYQNFSFT